jgi:signal transduction histidine kinase
MPDPDVERRGLGLSIVTQIAEGHGGSLAMLPGKDGVGTTVVLWLPLDETAGSTPEGSPFTDS